MSPPIGRVSFRLLEEKPLCVINQKRQWLWSSESCFPEENLLVIRNTLFPIFRDLQQKGNSVLLGLEVDVCTWVCVSVCVYVFLTLTCVNWTDFHVLRVILYYRVLGRIKSKVYLEYDLWNRKTSLMCRVERISRGSILTWIPTGVLN